MIRARGLTALHDRVLSINGSRGHHAGLARGSFCRCGAHCVVCSAIFIGAVCTNHLCGPLCANRGMCANLRRGALCADRRSRSNFCGTECTRQHVLARGSRLGCLTANPHRATIAAATTVFTACAPTHANMTIAICHANTLTHSPTPLQQAWGNPACFLAFRTNTPDSPRLLSPARCTAE